MNESYFMLIKINHSPRMGHAPEITGKMLLEQISSMRIFGEAERGSINPEVTQAIIFYDLYAMMKGQA